MRERITAALAGLLIAGCSAGGSTATECLGGATDCDGVCTLLASDDANCGACGNACTGALVCSEGACVALCQWEPLVLASLAVEPEGAVARTAADGWQGAAVVEGGLLAWEQAAGWSQLLVPAGFAEADDQLAVDVDLYLPAPASGAAWAGIEAFVDPVGGDAVPDQERGVLVRLVAEGGGARVEWWPWRPGGGGYDGERSTAVAPFTGGFHKVSLEGRRGATCRLAVYLDDADAALDAWSGDCDASGGYVSLASGAAAGAPDAVWSRLGVFRGIGPACVP